MKIGVICGVLGTIDRLKRLMASAKGQLPSDATFVIVGQKIDDASARWIKNKGLRLIRRDEALSFAIFNNLAAKELVDAEWLLLINDDIELKLGFWDAMQMMIVADLDVIGAKLLYPNGTIQHCGKMYTLDMFPFHVLRSNPADHPESMKLRRYPGVTFACVVIRRQLWDDLQGLDESFSNGYEDDDFCLRALELGAEVGVHPGAVALHMESATTGQDTDNKEAQWRKFQEKWVFTNRIAWPLGIMREWRFP